MKSEENHQKRPLGVRVAISWKNGLPIGASRQHGGLTWSTAVGEYSVIPLALHRHVRGAASPRHPTFFTTTLQVHVSGGGCLAAARFVVG